MKRRILTYGGYFEAFMNTLKEKEQEKIQYGLLLLKTQDRLPRKSVKLIRDGLYELRTEYGGSIFRTAALRGGRPPSVRATPSRRRKSWSAHR